MEVLNAQIPHAAVQHLAPSHLLRDDCAFHGQLAHLVRPVLLHGNRHLGAGFALDRVDHRVRAVRGNGQSLGACDIVALLDTSPGRGRIIIHQADADAVLPADDRHADAAALSRAVHAERLILLRRDIGRPLVAQTGDITDRGIVGNRLCVLLADIA